MKSKWIVKEMVNGEKLGAELEQLENAGYEVFQLFPTGQWFTVVARYSSSTVSIPLVSGVTSEAVRGKIAGTEKGSAVEKASDQGVGGESPKTGKRKK